MRLTYSHNGEVHRSIKLAQFSQVLSRLPTGPSTPMTRRLLPDTDEVDSLFAYRACPIRRAVDVLLLVRKRSKTALDRPKPDKDRKFQFEPKYVPGDYVCENRTPLKTSTAKRLATKTCTELMSRVHGPYEIVNIRQESITMWQNGVENIISINQIPMSTSRTATSQKKISGKQKDYLVALQPEGIKSVDEDKTLTVLTTQKYLVKRVLHHEKKRDVTHYVTRCYGYDKVDDEV